VQSICENGDKGTPAALDENSITGRAFLELAENVVKQTELRNAGQAPTQVVGLKK
jgi:ATP-binding protein involved in chromosome partitioning